MSFAQIIQDAWNKQAKWLILLRPLSCLYGLGASLNHQLYQMGVKSVYTAPVPVMVIGNITVGGSGKTPLLIQLIKFLTQRQVKVGVISRGYGSQGPFPAMANLDSRPEQVGDEPCLIVQSTGVPMAVGPDRKAAIELLLSQHELDLIISDDGLQHWALARQIEWIVLDLNRGLGNEKLLPEGYLRESKSRLETGTVIEHGLQPHSTLNMHLQAGQPYLLNPSENISTLFNQQDEFYAVVGIGFPQRFYKTLESIGIKEFQCHEFPDHHDYEIADLQFDDQNPIITTEKDAVKILPLLKQYPDFSVEIWVVPVEAILSEDCYQLLETQLKQLGVSLSQEI
ncbi:MULTISPECIES: tetraacyldisaccharide 4'-kinase [unclassified Acinetobacter]|uniref:tetraacyldisaccharide 4'-kinase n=1 Tax=unclassified Acinetobacter TaxID=196816 RepID=UPI00190DB2F6|nr:MULTISPECIES: tetraacyldisaccharide 4'-kinase [unclassified Acinetobacter]MBK0063023.1 tetraacyldisaccharide 4'-kinase [Acinetobacter sp. S55]MBK0066559.1 tetraacyldisaccharide 4'-kinase [Acinetobacter sp. S54]